MSTAWYSQAYRPETLFPAKLLTGLQIFLCPADWRNNSGEIFRCLRQFSTNQAPKVSHRQVNTVQRLDELPVTRWNCYDWTKSKSEIDIGNRRAKFIPEYVTVKLSSMIDINFCIC
jgi:hypothetical protein